MVPFVRASALRYIIDAFIVLAAGYELWHQLGTEYLAVAILVAIVAGVVADRVIAWAQAPREKVAPRKEIMWGIGDPPPGSSPSDSIPVSRVDTQLPPPVLQNPRLKKRGVAFEARHSGRVCDPGPYIVEPGDVEEVSLDLKKGERAKGRIISTDTQDFDWYIVDWMNSVKARNHESFDYVDGEEGVAASPVEITKKDAEPWFLLLGLPRRQNERKIRVELDRL